MWEAFTRCAWIQWHVKKYIHLWVSYAITISLCCMAVLQSILVSMPAPAPTFDFHHGFGCWTGVVNLDFFGFEVWLFDWLFDCALLCFTPSLISSALTAILSSAVDPSSAFGGQDLDQVLIHCWWFLCRCRHVNHIKSRILLSIKRMPMLLIVVLLMRQT